MTTGLSYILVSCCLAVLLLLARQEQPRTDDVRIFQYPRALTRALLFMVPVFVMLGAAAYFRESAADRIDVIGNYMLWGTLSTMIVASLYAYKYFMSFSIQISPQGLLIKKLWTSQTINFSDVKKIIVVEGGTQVTTLTLFGENERALFRIASTILRFSDLLFLLKEGTETDQIQWRYRDKWGKWKNEI